MRYHTRNRQRDTRPEREITHQTETPPQKKTKRRRETERDHTYKEPEEYHTERHKETPHQRDIEKYMVHIRKG